MSTTSSCALAQGIPSSCNKSVLFSISSLSFLTFNSTELPELARQRLEHALRQVLVPCVPYTIISNSAHVSRVHLTYMIVLLKNEMPIMKAHDGICEKPQIR